MEDNLKYGKVFLCIALISLAIGLIGGVLGSLTYIFPHFLHQYYGFSLLRPLHVSYAFFWIILAAIGSVYVGLSSLTNKKPIAWIAFTQISLWVIALIGIGYDYLHGNFGGREYWEFNPKWAIFILLSWFLFLINFFHLAKNIQKWPVYVWMWMTGIIFFIFTFTENYLWVIPYFRENFITDMTIQWKVAGSLVGSLNQLIYGVAFYLMDKLNQHNDYKVGSSKTAFFMYFLGLFNLMFNWGHHIYSLPTEPYIRYVAYAVSMTEWIVFLKIFFDWKKSTQTVRKYYSFFPYRFLMASDIWVFINVLQALTMSIPILNRYTHGTHVTVAHSMGTTIGINTMILFASVFMTFTRPEQFSKKTKKYLNFVFWGIQISLFGLFLSLNIAGYLRGFWQLSSHQSPFAVMMNELRPIFISFSISGTLLLVGFYLLLFKLLQLSLRKK